MTQIYIGNLPENCTDDFLRNRFSPHGNIKEVLLKGKFAFLDYEESHSADLAISYEKEVMDGTNDMMRLEVELANKQVKPVKGPVTLHLLNLPGDVNWEKLRTMLENVGNIQKAELMDDGGKNEWKRGIVVYELKEDAQAAIDRFHETSFEGTRLQVICPEPGPNSPLKQDKTRMRKASAEGKKRSNEDSSFPVRLVVPSNMIGAIIGKEGKTIRRITDSTGARVDIHRKENAHSLKKEITVFGNSDTCNQAIAMILKIMQDERATLSKVDSPPSSPHPPVSLTPSPDSSSSPKPTMAMYKMAVLELLAHNDLLLKIFGQRHDGLRDLMRRTNTSITITQSDELGKKQSEDRHIIIQGTPDDCCRAQREVSELYNTAFENDMKRIVQMTQGNGIHHASPNQSSYMEHMSRQQGKSPSQLSPTPQAYQNIIKQLLDLCHQVTASKNPMNLPPHLQKMRCAPESQFYNKMVTSPPRPQQPPLSPKDVMRLLPLLNDLQNNKGPFSLSDLSDYQKEQLVLAGQLISSGYASNAPAGYHGTPAGYHGTPAGNPSTPGGYPNTPASNPNTPGGYPNTLGGYPNTPGGYPNTPGGYPNTPGGYHNTPASYPNTPASYPNTPASYPNASPGYPNAQAGYPKTPTAPAVHQKYSTPKQPVLHDNSSYEFQGYSPFRYPGRPSEKSPMKPSRYTSPSCPPSDYDNFNMSSMFNGLEDAIGREEAGAQAYNAAQSSPTTYWNMRKSKEPLMTPREQHEFANYITDSYRNMNCLQGNGRLEDSAVTDSYRNMNCLQGNGRWEDSAVTDSYRNMNCLQGNATKDSGFNNTFLDATACRSPEDILGNCKLFNNVPGTGTSFSSSEGASNFLSDSLLQSSTWSTGQEDNSPLEFENSNLRRELQSMPSDREYQQDQPPTKNYYNRLYNQAQATQANYGKTSRTSFGQSPSSDYGAYEGSGGSNKLVEWSRTIPLDIGQKIESVRLDLEKLTGTRITHLAKCSDKDVVIRAVGSREGTEFLQQNILSVCDQHV